MRIRWWFLAGLLYLPALAWTQEMPAAAPAGRPRIGLVLSGGGARGSAHIGVLKVLDDLHVPIDAIAGTSMGAVIGGLYASGMSGRQIEQLFSSVDWQDSFRDRPRRADLAFRRKEEDNNFLIKLPLGLQGRRLLIPQGLIEGQKLTAILRRATLRVAEINNFDHLPIPFRAVATDLEDGSPVILSGGDLTTAMRASMSAPGVFIPVQREGRLLVDGGLSENLPIDVARAMGVDILIVVDAGYALQPRNKLKSITSISNQALAILVGHDVARQKATLGPRDILISPELPDLSSIDFSVVDRAVSAGEAAALFASPRLAALSISGDELARYAAARERPSLPEGNIEFVAADSQSHSYHRQIEDLFANLVGKPVNADAIDEDVETLYGRGYLQTLDYRLAQDSNTRQGLIFTAERNTWGPNYLRMGLSLEDDFRGLSTFNAAGRLTLTELNSLGAESVLDLQVGEDPHISAEFYQPLSNVWRFFIAPHAEAESHELPQVENGTQIGLYRISTTEYGVDTGSELGNWGEIRVGALADRGDTRVELGDFTVPPQDFSVNAAFLRFSVDKLDRTYFPHNGESFKVELHVEDNSASTIGTDLLTFDWRSAWTEGKYTQVLWVSGGSTVGGSQTNLRTFFPLGGFLQLSGVPTESLAGPQYAIGRAIFLRSVGNGGEGVLDVPAYAGVSFEAGNVWSSRNQISGDSLRKDASVFFGADTFLGPAYIAVGYDRNGTAAYYLFLGHSF